MAPMKGTSASVIVDEFIWGGSTSSAEVQFTINEHDVTNLDSTGMEYIPGLTTMRVVQNGYWVGPDTDGVADELHDRLGVSGAQVAFVPIKATTNTPVYVIPSAFNASLPIDASADAVITMNGEWAATNAGQRGKLISYNTTISGTGNGTSIDLGSAGSAGGYFYLHVHSIDGDASGTSTSSAIKVQSSSDDSTFADEGTVTFSATGGHSATMSGTVNRYLRISTSDMGGATSIVVTAYVVVTNVTM